jgi:exopolyphosphatase/guanosine-5'-triphosphate,3'-diphosphate pyrophosphatase
MRAAAIDVGTNTVRLLVGESGGPGGYRTVYAAQEITRLGEGLASAGRLQPEAIRRTLAVLDRFREAAQTHGAVQVEVVGTSALREAANREAFLGCIRGAAGIQVRVIPGEEEARLTLLGVRAGLGLGEERLLLMDIGGGSTELLLADGPDIRAAVSTGLGAVKLTEAYLRHDPPASDELQAAQAAVAARLGRVREGELPGLGHGERLVGTAGTVTSLAAIDLQLITYDPDRVNAHRLARLRIEELLRELAALPVVKRRHVPGLEPGRADVIVAGTVVCLEVMKRLDFAELVVSDGGLREGILLDILDRRTRSDPAPSPDTGKTQ